MTNRGQKCGQRNYDLSFFICHWSFVIFFSELSATIYGGHGGRGKGCGSGRRCRNSMRRRFLPPHKSTNPGGPKGIPEGPPTPQKRCCRHGPPFPGKSNP